MRSNLNYRLAFICALGLIFTTVLSGCGGQANTQPVQAPPEPVNNSPIIADLQADTQLVQPLGKSNIICAASDPDGDVLTYRWTASAGTIDSTGADVTWTAPADPGSYVITTVVSDGKGGVASQDITVTVPEKPNKPPIITAMTFTRPGRMPVTIKTNPTDEEKKKTPELVLRQWIETADVTCIAADPDKDQLTYIWRATGGKIIGAGPNIQWVAPAAGTYTINCEASDSNGGTASFTITVSVHCCSG